MGERLISPKIKMNHLYFFIRKYSDVFRQPLLLLAVAYFFFCCAQISYAEIGGAVAKWLFDEGKEDIAKEPISGLDGALNGDPKWVKGKFDNALEFSKTNWVEVEDNPLLNITDQLTLMVWANPTSEKQIEFAKIVAKLKDKPKGIDYPYQIAFQQDGGAGLVASANAGGKGVTTEPTIKGFTGWAHLAMVFDGKTLKLYMDGKEAASATAAGKLAATDTPFFIGGRAADSPQKFEGIVDEVRLFKRALSQPEIQALMEKGDEAQAVTPGNNLATTWGVLKATSHRH